MTEVPQLILNPKKSRHFDGRHPWVLANSIIEPTIPFEPGQIVELVQGNGSWVGRGIYNPASRIRLRLLQWRPEESLDSEWICRQLDAAVTMRNSWMHQHQSLDALRLVNSEGDGLSGLIVDRFGDSLVVQFTSLAMLRWKDTIVDWLKQHCQTESIFMTMEESAAKQEGVEAFTQWLNDSRESAEIEFEEHGIQLKIDLLAGQKTGYYLDQRANRLEAARSFQPGSLLDVCCYHAGFSLAACRHAQLTEVLAVDSSEKALATAQENAARNDCSQIEFQKADCFDFLKALNDQGRVFDNIVLDPPRMASHRSQIDSALRAYHRLNLSAVNLLRPGGTLVTCSCSGRVWREDFWGVLSSVAKRARRRLQVVESRGADFDHPVDIACPESEYLKCFICRVY